MTYPEGRKPLTWDDVQFADRPQGHPSTEALEIQKLQAEARDLQLAILWHEARAIRAIDEAKALRTERDELLAENQRLREANIRQAERDRARAAELEERNGVIRTDKRADAEYIGKLERDCERMKAALEPFGAYMHTDDGRVDTDNKGTPLPDDQGVGWVYLNHGHFRRARAALQTAPQCDEGTTDGNGS